MHDRVAQLSKVELFRGLNPGTRADRQGRHGRDPALGTKIFQHGMQAKSST
jgi:hypothetical protein